MKKNRPFQLNRRGFLAGGAIGLSGYLLRSLAIGLPPAWLSRPLSAFGQNENANGYQTLILSTSSAGDPINANCPGTYAAGLEHNPLLNHVDFNLGTVQTHGAESWALLPENLRARMAFFHYRTDAAAHIEYRSAMTFHGSVKNSAGNGSEMFASAMSELSHAHIGTLQQEPLPLCNEVLTVAGQPLQNLKPNELKSLFAGDAEDLDNIGGLRDSALDALHADLRANGTRSQRKFLDQYALSKTQARALGENLGSILDALPTDPDNPDNALDQVIAAVALAQLKVAPVITVNIPFGKDNHQDSTLEIEAEQTQTGTQVIARLWQELETANLTDDVTFATMNVFGRTLTRNGAGGRNHNRKHAVMAAFGPKINPGVYGGATDNGECSAIDPVSGLTVSSGGIIPENTMSSMGKSLARALGHDAVTVDQRISGGELVQSFLKT